VPLSWPTADSYPAAEGRPGRPAAYLFREGHAYQRAGVVLLDLAPVGAVTGDLFAAASVVGTVGTIGTIGAVCEVGAVGAANAACAASPERREQPA
jgi:hypothetical protein